MCVDILLHNWIICSESIWEPPEEYVSLAEQEEAQNKADESKSKEENTEQFEQAPIIKKPVKKKIRVDPKGSRGSAYGAWTTVSEET